MRDAHGKKNVSWNLKICKISISKDDDEMKKRLGLPHKTRLTLMDNNARRK